MSNPPSWPAPLTETQNMDGHVYFVNRYPRPIPVSERLPVDNQGVLIFLPRSGDWICGHLIGGEWMTCSPEPVGDSDVSHWVSMPPKPE